MTTREAVEAVVIAAVLNGEIIRNAESHIIECISLIELKTYQIYEGRSIPIVTLVNRARKILDAANIDDNKVAV